MKQGYTIIPDWMLDVDLDVYETIILGVIYGFSQDGESTFKGSQNYLAKKARCSRRKVCMALTRLTELNLIEKTDVDVRGMKLCEYRVRTTFTGCAPHAQGCAPHAHNNIDDNIDIYSLYNKAKPKFSKPSVEEVRSYCLERGNNIDAQAFVDFYESKGWMIGKAPMKDWKASVRTWERRHAETPKVASASKQKESVFEHNLKVMDEMFGTNLHEQGYGK